MSTLITAYLPAQWGFSFSFAFCPHTDLTLFWVCFPPYFLSFNNWTSFLVCRLLRNIVEFRLQEGDFPFWQIRYIRLYCLRENYVLGSIWFPETSALAYRETRGAQRCRIFTNHNSRARKEASITCKVAQESGFSITIDKFMIWDLFIFGAYKEVWVSSLSLSVPPNWHGWSLSYDENQREEKIQGFSFTH